MLGRAARPSSITTELNRAAAGVRQLFDAAACSVALVDVDGSSLTFAAADGAGARAIVGVSLPIDRGIVGWVAMSGQGIAVADVTQDTRFARDVAETTDYVPSTILAVPLVDARDGVTGVLEVLDPQLGSVDTGRTLNVLGTVGDQLASIIRLAKVYDRLGASLLHATAEGVDEETFGRALHELTADDDDAGLVALADTFHRLSLLGPEAAALGRRILEDVLDYQRTRR